MRISPARILTLEEVRQIVEFLRDGDTLDYCLNLAIFRLSACCGMRCKEIHGLDIHDFFHNGEYPFINIRKEITKGEKGKRKIRKIPLWWDKETYDDLSAWHKVRLKQTDGENGPFIAALRSHFRGQRISKHGIAGHWTRTISKVLGADRARSLSIHCGRHSFTSLAHAAGIPLASIRDALGHSSLAVTDMYCHSVLDDGLRDIFTKKGQ